MQKVTDLEFGTKDQVERGLTAAVRYLSYRPRSEAELRERLQQRGFSKDTQDAVIGKLTEDGLINDEIFAQFWKEARQHLRPASKWATSQELKQKGIDKEIIDKVVSTVDDEDNAYRAALEKSQRLADIDYESFRRKLGGHLQRRGFSSEVIRHTLKRIWEERQRPPEPVFEACACMKNEVKNAK